MEDFLEIPILFKNVSFYSTGMVAHKCKKNIYFPLWIIYKENLKFPISFYWFILHIGHSRNTYLTAKARKGLGLLKTGSIRGSQWQGSGALAARHVLPPWKEALPQEQADGHQAAPALCHYIPARGQGWAEAGPGHVPVHRPVWARAMAKQGRAVGSWSPREA